MTNRHWLIRTKDTIKSQWYEGKQKKTLGLCVTKDIRLDELQGVMHMTFDRMAGNLKSAGDFFLSQSLFAAEAEDQFLLRGQFFDRMVKQLLRFPKHEQILGRICRFRKMGNQVFCKGLFPDLFPKRVKNMVAGNDKKIVIKLLYGDQAIPFYPYGQKDFLDKLFGQHGGFGQREGYAIDRIPIFIKNLSEGFFVAVGNLMQSFSIGVFWQHKQSWNFSFPDTILDE
jgi:hypothetical protein